MCVFLEADIEELEKELNSLLESSKDPVDLPSVPQKPSFPASVVLPSISDAELEAELEKLTLSDGGMFLSLYVCNFCPFGSDVAALLCTH